MVWPQRARLWRVLCSIGTACGDLDVHLHYCFKNLPYKRGGRAGGRKTSFGTVFFARPECRRVLGSAWR
jgi:hypothetical protein